MWELYREMEDWGAEQVNYFATELNLLLEEKIRQEEEMQTEEPIYLIDK